MAFQGNAAYQLDSYQTYETSPRRSLSVHEGGVSARTSRDVSSIMAAVKVIVAATLLFAGIGAARVLLTVRTVGILREASSMESAVNSARDASTELKMERSVLTSADRIQRIATENYGMVYATEVDTIVLAPKADQDGSFEAQSTEVADPSSPEA